MVRHEKIFRSFLSIPDGLDEAEKPFHAILSLYSFRALNSEAINGTMCVYDFCKDMTKENQFRIIF